MAVGVQITDYLHTDEAKMDVVCKNQVWCTPNVIQSQTVCLGGGKRTRGLENQGNYLPSGK